VDQELQEKLRAKYPTVFAQCSFSLGNGWFGLLDEAAAKLEPLGLCLYEAHEKLASLRLYSSAGRTTPKEVRDLVHEIEMGAYHKSVTVCEDCGQAGSVRDFTGYFRVSCDVCAPAWEIKQARFAPKKRKKRK
jgi:hypothetical protein